MAEVKNRIALAQIGGNVVIVGCEDSQFFSVNQKQLGDSGVPILDFLNAVTLEEFLTAFEVLTIGCGLLFPELSFVGENRESVTEVRHLARLFHGEKPSQNAMDKVRATIERWPSTVPDDWACDPCWMLDDILKAKNDLIRVGRVLAWRHGKTDLWSLDDLVAADALLPLDIRSDTSLARYYSRTCAWQGAKGPALVSERMFDNAQLSDDYSSAADFLLTDCAKLALARQRDYIPGRRFPFFARGDDLPILWDYLFTRITQETPGGSVGICKQCNRFFIQKGAKRKTYCDRCATRSSSRMTEATNAKRRNYLRWPSETYRADNGTSKPNPADNGDEIADDQKERR